MALATLHDSGGERALMADAAHAVDLPFAPLTESTRERLGQLLAPGLEPTNPLDVWGTGAGTEGLFTECMAALADDPTVDVVALSIDMVHEFDGDESYPMAVEAMLRRTSKPVVVLSHVASALDQIQAARLRAQGVPVFEGTYSGALALRHLFDQAAPPSPPAALMVDEIRHRRWRDHLLGGPLDAVTTSQLLADYGLRVAAIASADSREASVAAAGTLGYPVVLKTDEPGVEHKSDVGGVKVGLADEADVRAAYDDLERRLGGRVVVQRQASGQVELALGIVRDPLIGPLIVLGIGGTLVEVVNRRRVALPPLSRAAAEELVDGFDLVSTLLAGVRGNPPSDREAVVEALVGLGQLAIELGDVLDALDVNPLLCSAEGAVAVDALALPRTP